MRERGFYWVKSDKFTDLFDGWAVVEWAYDPEKPNGLKGWFFNDTLVDDDYWDVIDERQIIREPEPKISATGYIDD